RDELPERGVTMQPEVTDLLRRIDAELAEPEDRRSLGRLLRAHAGDSLFEIAREHAIKPETLRQRICRLRRQLRARHVWPFLLLFGVVTAVATLDRAPAVRLPSAQTADVLASYQGRWGIVDARPSKYLALGLRIT